GWNRSGLAFRLGPLYRSERSLCGHAQLRRQRAREGFVQAFRHHAGSRGGKSQGGVEEVTMSRHRTRNADHKPALLVDCDLCHRKFEFGGGRYEGKCNSHHKLSACKACYSSSEFAPYTESALEAHFVRHGLQPFPRNSNGLYIWPNV